MTKEETQLDEILNLDHDIKKNIAKSPSANTQQLGDLSKDEHHEVRRAVASNPNATKEHLGHLSKDEDSGVRALVARHPNTSKEHLGHLSKDNSDSMYGKVNSNVANNPNATKEHLGHLSKGESGGMFGGVRRSVADHPNTSKEHLGHLSKDEDPIVRRAVAGNPNTSKEHLDRLSKDEHHMVRSGVGGNPNASKEHLDRVIKDTGSHIEIARNPSASKEHLDHLSKSKDKWIRQEAKHSIAQRRKNSKPQLKEAIAHVKSMKKTTNEDTQLDEEQLIAEDSYDKYVKLHKASFGVHPEDDNTEIHHVQKTSKGTMHVVWSHPDHNDDERGNYHVSAFKHDGKKGDYAGGGPESSHHSEEDAISHAKSLKKSTNEDISDMIDQLVDGNTEQAEQAFDAAISVKVIDALDTLKMDVSQNLYK